MPEPTPRTDAPKVQVGSEAVPTSQPDVPTQAYGATETPRILPELPGYEIEREVGRGGMGIVYRAVQKSLNRVVALKVVRDSALAGPEQLARFRAEAESVARLQHPHIVQIHDLDEKNGQPFFAMEFMPGGTLADRLAGKPLPPREAAELLEPLARAVHYAHQQGILHRDIKPSNILLGMDGEPKISDFGLVKRLGEASAMTPASLVLGTPAYMAPEQAGGTAKEIGPPVDVYALGALLYEALTGKPPFASESLVQTLDQVRFQEPPPPSRTQPDIPTDLEMICLRCLSKEPERRYPSSAALAEDLQNFLEGKALASASETGTGPIHVAGYEVWEELARGGVWLVHKARDVRAKRLIALKRVRSGSPMTAEQLARLRAVAEEARRLTHPNIAAVLDVGGIGPRLHLAVELIEGASLTARLAGKPLAPVLAARLVEMLASAVQHAHEQGLIHCHLHPSNVLLAGAPDSPTRSDVEVQLGVPKVIGFEMARRTGESGVLESLDGVRPTSHAMAPEQLFNKPEQIGPGTDVYSLGIVLYQSLTGRPPYEAKTTSDLLLKVAFETVPRPRLLNHEIPTWLDQICLACLHKDPTERYTSAAALASDLRLFLEGKRPTVSPPTMWERLRTWVRTSFGK